MIDAASNEPFVDCNAFISASGDKRQVCRQRPLPQRFYHKLIMRLGSAIVKLLKLQYFDW